MGRINFMMRFRIGVTFCFLLLSGLTACAELPSSGANQQAAPSPPRRQVLEVVTDASGMWYPNGPTLNLRVFSDGSAEYEAYPEPKRGEPTALTGVPRALKATHLSDADFDVITRAASSPEFTAAAPVYERVGPTMDVRCATTLRYTSGPVEKVITVIDFEDQYELRGARFPPSVLLVLERVFSTHRSLLEAEWHRAAG